MVITLVIVSHLIGADIGPRAPAGVYVLSRDSAVCGSAGQKRDPIALVVTDKRRVQRASANATVAELLFRDNGVTRPGDVIETVPFQGARTFRPPSPMIVVINSDGCQSQTLAVGPEVRACLMVVLDCAEPDAG